jgi:hypothetical protein
MLTSPGGGHRKEKRGRNRLVFILKAGRFRRKEKASIKARARGRLRPSANAGAMVLQPIQVFRIVPPGQHELAIVVHALDGLGFDLCPAQRREQQQQRRKKGKEGMTTRSSISVKPSGEHQFFRSTEKGRRIFGLILIQTQGVAPNPHISRSSSRRRPLAQSSLPKASPEPPRSTSVPGTEVLRGGSGEDPVRLRRGYGAVSGRWWH